MPRGTQKAQAAAKANRGDDRKKLVKKRTKLHFYRPKTLKLARNPKYSRKSVPSVNKLDKYRVIKFPLTTESRDEEDRGQQHSCFYCGYYCQQEADQGGCQEYVRDPVPESQHAYPPRRTEEGVR